jgi:hypothetical protein
MQKLLIATDISEGRIVDHQIFDDADMDEDEFLEACEAFEMKHTDNTIGTAVINLDELKDFINTL